MNLAVANVCFTNPLLALQYTLGNLLADDPPAGGSGGIDVTDLVNGAKEAEQSSSLTGVETKVKELGGGMYRILFMAGVFLIILGLATAALKLFFSDSQTRKDAKGDIVWKVLAGIFFFAGIMLVILFSKVGSTLFEVGE